MTTTHVSKSVLDREADARFWAQTHYKIGQKLDPADPIDRTMVPVWLDIWHKVRREDEGGRLVLTYNHPEVERHLDDAAIASHAADGHLQAAVAEPDPDVATSHARAAADAARAAADSARKAAQRQPPTVSPVVADAAAATVAAAAGLPPTAPITGTLPADHPAVASAAAQPILHPDAAIAPGDHPADGPPAHPRHPRGHGRGHGHHDQAGPSHPMRPDHQIAAARAVDAPQVAAQVHEDARARDATAAPPPQGSLHPRASGSIRELASRLAGASQAPFVGVDFSSDGQWSAPGFGTAAEAGDWYARAAEHPDRHRYLAHFDRSAGSGPVDEVFGSSAALAGQGADADPSPPEASDAAGAGPPDAGGISRTAVMVVAGIGLVAIALVAARSQGVGQAGFPGAHPGGRR